MSRRILAARLALLGLLFLGLASAREEETEPIVLGSGRHTYEWVRGWAKPPWEGTLGYTHGCVAIDSRDRVYVNTDTERAVVVLDSDGNVLKTFGAELAGGLHGMSIVQEGESEFLYLAHAARGEVYKATLDGEILWTLGWPEESGHYANASEYHPTSIAVAPNGHIYVADGYGKSWIHQYDAERHYVRSLGGPGEAPGQLRNPHGLWIHASGDRTFLIVADRENARLQTFDLEGKPLRVLTEGLRRPCHVHPREGELAVADIDGKVTILGGDGQVVLHLGENENAEQRKRRNVPVEAWRDGVFISPHCAHWDSKGDLYVVDWLLAGRVTKLRRLAR